MESQTPNSGPSRSPGWGGASTVRERLAGAGLVDRRVGPDGFAPPDEGHPAPPSWPPTLADAARGRGGGCKSMRSLFSKLWADDKGAVVAPELILIVGILVIGLIPGLVALRNAEDASLADIGNELLAI